MDDQELFNRLAYELSDLAEKVLRRENSLVNLPIQKEVTSFQYYYLIKHFDELDNKIRGDVLEAEINCAKKMINNFFGVGSKKSYADEYPEEMIVSESFAQWVLNNDDSVNKEGIITYDKLINPTSIIKSSMKINNPEFEYNKVNSNSSTIVFSKKSFSNHTINLIFDKGTKRSFFSVLFGLDKPEFRFDIGRFFNCTQSSYYYSSQLDVEDAVKKSLIVVMHLMPLFEESVKKAIEGDGRTQGTDRGRT